MNVCAPSLMVAVVGPGRTQSGVSKQLKERLLRRGLRAHVLRSWHEMPICDCDILLLTCPDKEMDGLVQQIEKLWTQKWAAWYQEKGGARDGK